MITIYVDILEGVPVLFVFLWYVCIDELMRGTRTVDIDNGISFSNPFQISKDLSCRQFLHL